MGVSGVEPAPHADGGVTGDRIANQMKAPLPERGTTVMIRGVWPYLPPSLLKAATRMMPYAKNAAIPFAHGALSSLGDNVIDSIFGAGILNSNMSQPSDDYRLQYVPSRKPTTGMPQKDRGWEDSQDDGKGSKNTRIAKVDNKTEDESIEARSA